jgi:hypothetical protein
MISISTTLQHFPFKEGDTVSYRVSSNMIGSGELFQICEGDDVIIMVGNGARGLRYVSKSQIIRE